MLFMANIPTATDGYVVTFLYLLYSPKIGNKASRFFSNLDLAKLITMRPEQGFRQLEVSTAGAAIMGGGWGGTGHPWDFNISETGDTILTIHQTLYLSR